MQFCFVNNSGHLFGAEGVDKDGVFTQKHVGSRQLVGDKGLRKQVSMPKDLCVALTTESDGSVFNARKVSWQRRVSFTFIHHGHPNTLLLKQEIGPWTSP